MKHRTSIFFLALVVATAPVWANPPTRPPAQRVVQRRNLPRPFQGTATVPVQRMQPASPTAQSPTPRTPPASPTSSASSQPPGQAVAPQPPSSAGSLTALQIVQRIQDFYDRTNDFQADFTQVSRSRLTGEEQRAGHVIFKRPGRMRWNYTTNGDVIVSNGTTLIAYQAEERQAFEQNLAQSQMPTALAFLMGTGRLTDAFTFRLLDANQFQYPMGYVLEARPTTPQPTYERVVFYVDRASFQVTRTALIDAQGNINRIEFRNPRVNLDVPESTFSWRPPADVRIVRP